MSDTLPNVIVTSNTWVGLRAATGIATGALYIEVLGSGSGRINVGTDAPEIVEVADWDTVGYAELEYGRPRKSDANDPEVWVWSGNGIRLQVKLFEG